MVRSRHSLVVHELKHSHGIDRATTIDFAAFDYLNEIVMGEQNCFAQDQRHEVEQKTGLVETLLAHLPLSG